MAISEEASQDYVKTDWSPGMPITEGRMDKIEQGIYINREAIQALDIDVNGQDGVSSKVTTLTDGIGTNTVPAYSNKTIWDAIKSLYNATTVEGQAQKIEQGANAWSQIVAAVGGYDELGNLNQSLLTTLENITSVEQNDISAIMAIFGQKAGANGAIPAYTDVDTVYKDVTNIRDILGKNDAGTAYYFNNTTDTVAIKMRDLIRRVGDAETELYTNSISGTTYASLADRLNGMTNALQTLGGTNGAVPLLQDEITEAHTSSAIKVEQNGELVNKVYATLDERFEDIEGAANLSKTDITNIKQEISEARLNANSTLDARFDAIDGGSAPSRTLPNVISEINAARGVYDSINARLNQDESNINHKVDTDDVYNDLDYTQEGKVLDARQGKALQDTIDTLNTNIDSRLDAIEDELDSARIQIDIDENTQEPIMSTLDQRLNSMDSTAAGIRADLTTVITELGMTDTNGLKTIGTRVDDLADNVAALATELDMQMSEGKIIDTNSRIDDLAYDISHTATQEDNTVGLTQRISTLESSLDADEGNIVELDQRLDAIDGGTALNTTNGTLAERVTSVEANKAAVSDLTALTSRVSTLETKDTEVISVANFEELVANAANSTKDYLVGPDNDNLYKYYRIIETSTNTYEKVLISGGGTGSGNNNAEVYSTVTAFNQASPKKLDTEYYVLDDDNIWHHYRYLDITQNPIEIGILKNSIHNYQIARYDEVNAQSNETVSYLDLYQFDYGTSKTSEQINEGTDSSYRIARIELPRGGGGDTSTNYKLYAKVQGGQTKRLSYSDIMQNGLRLQYSYTCYRIADNDYNYKAATYTISSGNTIIYSSAPNVVDPLDKISTIEGSPSYDAGTINITSPDLKNYCSKNQTTAFNLTLHVPTVEGEDEIRDLTVTVYVTAVELSLKSTFSDQQTYSINNNLTIPYTFEEMSDQNPEFIILLDNNPVTATVTNTNITIRSNQLVNKLGVHNLVIKASQVVSGTTLYSDPLTYQLGLIDGTNDSLMLFSGESLKEQLVEQYAILKLPYYLYIPNGETKTVTYLTERVTYNDSGIITSRETATELSHSAENLITGTYNYSFRIHDMIAKTEYYIVTITCENQSLQFKITATQAAEQIYIKPDHLLFNFKPEGYSNNTETVEQRLWSETRNGITYRMRIPDGAHFDWRTGGWMTINDVPCFCVKAGSRVEFVRQDAGSDTVVPLTLFWNNMEQMGGSNFKCIFKIDNVKTPNAPFLTSLDTNINTVINYGKTILSSKQDVEDEKTLLYRYLNTKYIYVQTINSSNKTVKEAIGMTVPNTEPFASQITEAIRVQAETDAASSNNKKIKKYIGNIYDIANQANNSAHRKYLLNVLAGNADETAEIDYTLVDVSSDPNKPDLIPTVKRDILNHLKVLENAQNIYNRLVDEETDSSTITYAYRQVEPINLDAILNGFVVEGKDGKDGIIAMIQFTFSASIETNGNFIQSIVDSNGETTVNPISTNSFEKTGTFRFAVTKDEVTKYYEVEMIDEAQNGTYTEIKGIRDASNVEEHRYGLELNALGSNIYLPSGVVSYAHSEGDIIEFEYNVNPAIPNRINSSIIIYEDGVPSAAKLYATNSNIFEQYDFTRNVSTAGNLTIGSDDCDVYIYKMRLYDAALDNKDILGNFYADGLTVQEMTDRYNRNKNLLVTNETDLTPQLVAQECPDLRIIMIETPNLTGGKTSFIKNSKIRCIYKNGRPEDNWMALNAYHAGQGTSSDNYGAAGRNLDIMFGFDGEDTVIIPKPQKNNYTFDPNYKSILIKGLNEDLTNDIFTVEDVVDLINNTKANGAEDVTYNTVNNPTAVDTKYYKAGKLDIYTGGTGLTSFTQDSIPNNWFNIKVNIASSENTNNAFLQKRFDRFLPYRDKVPAMNRDSRIKNDMEFFNCVIFIKETGTPNEFTQDKDIPAAERPWHFYGIGNIGDSKKTDKTRVNVEGDPYEFCVEISDNDLLLSGFNTGVFYISEASKTRSQTARTELNGNADIPEISTATTAHICENNEYTVTDSIYSFNIEEPDNTTLYLIPISSTITYYERYMYINDTWTKVGEPITFTRTSYGIKYPISKAEWECDLNEYHSSLYNFGGKGWDKSFEFRYDITTKDGETVARNDLEAAMNDLHQKANKTAMADMYSWIVTETNDDFATNIDKWFIKESPLYWYLFTERYTMIDSRAKNTFYHYGKVYISTDEYNGVIKTALESANAADYAVVHEIKDIKDKNNNILISKETIAAEEIAFKLAAATFIYNNRDTFELDDEQAAFHNGYRFELWDYDDDTALGINNNGQMVFSAGLEDIDKDPNTGWIYNEAESVIWRRIRENMYNDLSALYRKLKENQCFNAQNLIDEFDAMQAQFPEELWRLDFQRKYYRPFTDLGETIYLNDMANGRKKYQRRQFERNMAIYINSKYQRNGSYEPNDLISLRPQFIWDTISDTTITVRPYSTMYINFAIGNTDNTDDADSALSIRVERGEPYVIETSKYTTGFTNKQFIIYNASRLMSIEGLGNFHSQQFSLGAAKKLTTLILGNPDPAETNTSMDTIEKLGLGDGLPLLETLDLQNIQFANAPAVFDLTNFPLLKNLNATGCNIRSFIFKEGGMLKNIIFQSVLTSIEFKNLYNLIDTYDENNNLVRAVTLTGAANLLSYQSENSYAHSWEIVQNMLTNNRDRITKLILKDIDWTINDLTDLSDLIVLQERLGNNMLLQGTIHVTGTWSNIKINNYKKTFGINNINFDTSGGTETQEYELTFYLTTEDAINKTNLYYSSYLSVEEGMTDTVLGDDPVYVGLCPTPQKAPTVSKSYFFGTNKNRYFQWNGWRIYEDDTSPSTNMVVNTDLRFIAIFGEETRTYPLRWYLNEDDDESKYVYEVANVPYNSSYETGLAPTVLDLIIKSKTTAELNPDSDHTYKIFTGWAKEPINLDSTYLNSNQTAFCIYGTWETGNESLASIKAQETLDEKKLLVLTNTNDKILPTSSTYTVNMGYDNNSGTTIIGPDASLGISPRGEAYTGEDVDHPILNFEWFNGSIDPTIRAVSNIRPFEHMDTESFTLAIDYQINTTYLHSVFSSGYAIIGGCYSSNSGDGTAQGFAIYYDIASEVVKACFGNLANINTYSSSDYSCALTNSNSANGRNIVVIRHIAGTNTLQFYSGISGAAGMLLSINDDNFRQTLTWSDNNIFSPLCFGHFTTSAFTALAAVHPGVGVSIHWSKYWNQDLGHNECTLLASWPHETITFGLADYSNDGTNDVLVTNSKNLIFSALQLSQYGGPYMQSYEVVAGNTVNWGSGLTNQSNSSYKKISNQRFFLGLPIKLQSIISRTVGNAATTTVVYNFHNMYQFTTSSETVDLAFIPTYKEVGGYDSDYECEAYRALPWYTASNTQVFNYGINNFIFNGETNYEVQYMNLRFFGIPLKATVGDNHIFTGYSGSSPVYDKINIQSNPNGGIVRGDIFIHNYVQNNNTITEAYIYADSLDVAKGVQIVNASSGDLLYCPSGGWVKAGSWWTRTPASTYENRAIGSQPYFYIEGNTGEIKYNSSPAEGGAYFVYEFGI